MKTILLLIPTLLILSCVEMAPTPDVSDAGDIREEETHWSVLYIRDHCSRCPDCCVVIDEDDDGLVDR